MGEGFDSNGEPRMCNASVMAYKNEGRGEEIVAGTMCMNDQLAISNSKNMSVYSSLYTSTAQYVSRGLPLNAETLLAYHLKLVHKLNIAVVPFTWYEIFRLEPREEPSKEDNLANIKQKTVEWFERNSHLVTDLEGFRRGILKE